MSLLAIHELDVVYRRHGEDIRAVASASLSVDRGQIVGLVGESGCGKSSLARAAVGLVAPAAGEIVFDGSPLAPLRRGARSKSATRLQMVFQNPYSSLNPRRTIGSQVADGLRLAGESDRLVRRRRVAELLDKVGLSATATSRFPHQFSGGQRQRVAIARALAANPSVIVLDEPLSSLDASAQAQVANLLVGLARDLDLALLLISHDLAIVRHIADTVFVMYLGEIVERGPTRAVWTDAVPSLHRGARRCDPARRRLRHPPRGTARRGARPGPAAERLPLPSALSLRLRPLPDGGSAAVRPRCGPGFGVLPPRPRTPHDP